MQLQHTHHLAGPGRVNVSAPELPVFITVDPEAEYRATDILADRGLAAWAGPSGVGGVALGIEVARPTVLSSLKRTFLRGGSYVSGGGSVVSGGHGTSVRATGRGSIACGGSITGAVVTGDGVQISGLEKSDPLPVGVHITVPPLSTFQIKGAQSVTVRYGDQADRPDEDTLRKIFAVGVAGDMLVVSW